MSITATTQQQRQLLDLQSLDSQLTRLRTQLSELRDDAQLAELRKTGAMAVDHAKTVQARVEEHQAASQQAEQAVEETTKRRNSHQSRLDADKVSPRDVQAVTMDIAELTVRIDQLEETQVEAMQTLETSQTDLANAQAAIAEAEQAVNVRIATINEQGQQLSKQGKELTVERAALAETLPTDLVAEYEQLRDANHGIGVVELTPKGLSGAGLPIAPAELAEIKKLPADQLAYCPDTGAILARTELV
ncbi:zinc ribbon domain-containing protein [Yaniella halotolerans]|uniref:zinc ribbon domain-containing protein n=1 Tax=Yaniella halotolerans TaxID=225453 RepID=UPI0003B326AA|nr:hypothetical protein [Yaniella halotolerans]